MSVVIDGSNGVDIGAGNLTFPDNTTQTTAPVSPIKQYLITSNVDIALPLSASGGNTTYASVGSSFTAEVPANGIIKLTSFTGRILNDANSTTNHSSAIGIRIGSTNYWFGQYNNNGTLSAASNLGILSTSALASTYYEFYGAVNSGFSYSLDVAGNSIPTGTQTVTLVMCNAQLTATLKGTVKQTRIFLEIIE